ncbi:MAG: hypothetical protein WA005_10010 [Candidatus Binataceae bacterium]
MKNTKSVKPLSGGESTKMAAPPNGAEPNYSIAQRRLTVVLPEQLDENLSCFALDQGLTKGEIVKRAVAKFLRDAGLRPDLKPRVQITYQE